MREKTFKMTRDEVIEELMDEWWNSLDPKVAERMIGAYLEDVGADLEDDNEILVREMQEIAKRNNRKFLERFKEKNEDT